MLSSLWPKPEQQGSSTANATTAADTEEGATGTGTGTATSAGGGAATTTTPLPPPLPPTMTTTKKNKRAGKQPNTVLRAQYRSYSHENGTKLQWECVHCSKIIFSWRVTNFNASRANMHIQSCSSAPNDIKIELQAMTQAAKKQRVVPSEEVAGHEFGDTAGTVAVEGLLVGVGLPHQATSSASVLLSSPKAPVVPKRGATISASQDVPTSATAAPSSSAATAAVPSTPQDLADRAFALELRAALARLEPLSRVLDPVVQQALVSQQDLSQPQPWGLLTSSSAARRSNSNSSGPRTFETHHFPHDVETLYRKFIPTIDADATRCLEEQMRHVLGQGSISIIAVGTPSPHVCFTYSKGACYHFERLLPVTTLNALSEREVHQCVAALQSITDKYKTELTNVSHDDTTNAVLRTILQGYQASHPSSSSPPPRITLCRDPAQSLRIHMKALEDLDCLSKTVSLARDVVDAVSGDAAREAWQQMRRQELLATTDAVATAAAAAAAADTFAGEVAAVARHGLKSHLLQFVLDHKSILTQDILPYLESIRTVDDASSHPALVEKFTPDFWDRAVVVQQWWSAWERAERLASDPKFSISAVLPLVRALNNELRGIIDAKFATGKTFAQVLGPESVALVKVLHECFDDGVEDENEGAEHRARLLTKNHVWCHLVDPFRNQLQPQVWIPDKPAVVSDLLEAYAPGRSPEARDQRSALRSELNALWTQSGKYAHCFDHDRLEELDEAAGLREQAQLTLRDVRHWLERTGGYASRLAFFGQVAKDDLYRLVLEPLLSMRPVAPITTARVARTLTRPDVHPERREVLLRVGLNLRFLQGSLHGIDHAFLLDDATELLDVDPWPTSVNALACCSLSYSL